MLEWTRNSSGLVGALAPLIVRIECSKCHQMRPSSDYPAVIGDPTICNPCSGYALPRIRLPERGDTVGVATHTTGAPSWAVFPPPPYVMNASPSRAACAHALAPPIHPQYRLNTDSTRTSKHFQRGFQPPLGAVKRLICRIEGGKDCDTYTTGDRRNGGTDTN